VNRTYAVIAALVTLGLVLPLQSAGGQESAITDGVNWLVANQDSSGWGECDAPGENIMTIKLFP
jgi:hypothetical protein